MGDHLEMLKLLRILATMKDDDIDDCESFSDMEEEIKVGREFIDESFPPEFNSDQKTNSNVGKIVNTAHKTILSFAKIKEACSKAPLKDGDCVTMKEELRKDFKYPKESSFGIITRILDKPIYPNKGKVKTNLIEHEPLTIAVLFFVDDKDESKGIVEFYYNEARLKPVDRDTCCDPSLYDRLCAKRKEFFARDRPFVPGDLVMWKPGLSNKLRPEENGVGVVVDVVSEPHFNYTEQITHEDSLFYEPLDLIVGTLSRDGDLITFSYDSRRFMHAPKEIVDEAMKQLTN